MTPDSCDECGVLVLNPELHGRWHSRQLKLLKACAEMSGFLCEAVTANADDA